MVAEKHSASFMRQAFFSILALTVPSAACFMLSASSKESILVKYLNQAPERGSSISIVYVMTQSLPKFNEQTIHIRDKYHPTLEDIFRKSIYPTLHLAKCAQKQSVSQSY